jgi:hypothetical protein
MQKNKKNLPHWQKKMYIIYIPPLYLKTSLSLELNGFVGWWHFPSTSLRERKPLLKALPNIISALFCILNPVNPKIRANPGSDHNIHFFQGKRGKSHRVRLKSENSALFSLFSAFSGEFFVYLLLGAFML